MLIFGKYLREVQPLRGLSHIGYFWKQKESLHSLNSFEQKDILGDI